MPTKKTPTLVVPEPVQPVIEDSDNITVTLKRSHFYVGQIVFALLTGLLVGYIIWGRNTPAPAAVVPAQVVPQVTALPAQPTVVPTPIKYDIVTDGFPSIGPADAPITIVEFSDYQCPYCTAWQEQTYQPLMNAYPDKIRLVYRNYPLPFHQNAYKAAEAAECAGDQNAYWQYHDKLFAEKAQLNNSAGTVLDDSVYVQFAADLGLDTTAFQTCLSTEKYKQKVQADIDYANSLPPESNGEVAVGGTPTFFINGYRLVGAVPLSYFQQIIDAQLKNQ